MNRFAPNVAKRIGKIWINYFMKKDPCILADRAYQQMFNRKINWDNPKDLIEKIYWLQIFSDTSLWTLCADKYRVRDYITQKGLDKYLNTLYGVWEDPAEIDFDSLPNSFVLKPNNGSGDVQIVRDKTKMSVDDQKAMIDLLKTYVGRKYGESSVQMHYKHIKPCVVAEKNLNNSQSEYLTDYKFHCAKGKVILCNVIYDRSHGNYNEKIYDTDWNDVSYKYLKKSDSNNTIKTFPKPECYEEMIRIATILSEDFAEVRVDLYNIDGHPVFGELTFSPGYGGCNQEFYDHIGSFVELPPKRAIKNR